MSYNNGKPLVILIVRYMLSLGYVSYNRGMPLENADVSVKTVWNMCHIIGVSRISTTSILPMYVWDMCHIIGVSYPLLSYHDNTTVWDMCRTIGISICKDERDEPVWKACHIIG